MELITDELMFTLMVLGGFIGWRRYGVLAGVVMFFLSPLLVIGGVVSVSVLAVPVILILIGLVWAFS